MSPKLNRFSTSSVDSQSEENHIPIFPFGKERIIKVESKNQNYQMVVGRLGGSYLIAAVELLEEACRQLYRYSQFKVGEATNVENAEKKRIKKYANRYFLLDKTGWGGEKIQGHVSTIITILTSTKAFLREHDLPITLTDAVVNHDRGTYVAGYVVPKPALASSSTEMVVPATLVKGGGSTLEKLGHVKIESFNLTVERMLQGERGAIQTIIHEASHAGARTGDNGYIKFDGSTWVNDAQRPSTVEQAINNADSIAWFVIKIARKPSDLHLFTDGVKAELKLANERAKK